MKFNNFCFTLLISSLIIAPLQAQLVLRSSKLTVTGITSFATLPGAFTLLATHSPLAGISVGTISMIAGYVWANRDTPEYKLHKALKLLNEVKNSPEYIVVPANQASANSLRKKVEKIYLNSQAPLADCFERYVTLRNTTIEAQKLSETACMHCKENLREAKARTMALEAENCFIDLLEAQENIENIMLLLKKDPTWHKSVKAKFSKDTAESAKRAAKAAEDNAWANTVNAMKPRF